VEADLTPDEEELIRRYRNGDGDALCVLFDRYDSVLRARAARFLPSRLRRRHSIADVLQEARMVAFDRRADFEPRDDASLRNWLLEIVTRKARRAVQRHDGAAMRSARREVTRAQRAATGQIRADLPSPSQVAIASELAELVERAMRSLPEHHREVLDLAIRDQRNLKEIAVLTGRSYDAVKKAYGRALARLMRTLRDLRGESCG
jgi:RNA polymerase sigma factor (sigma-70 family)